IDADIHSDVNEISEVDLMLYAVDHKAFKLIEDSEFLNKLNNKKSIIVDLKNRFKQYQNANKVYWSL
ncbi:nucleotide sugar dehydrogenase, partial [Staphylococcus shinii]